MSHVGWLGTIRAARCFAFARLVANEGQKSHKSSSLYSSRDRMLTYCRTAGFATNHNPSMSIDEFFQQINVFIVHIHWAWTFAIDKDGILFDGLGAVVFAPSRFSATAARCRFACHFLRFPRWSNLRIAHLASSWASAQRTVQSRIVSPVNSSARADHVN